MAVLRKLILEDGSEYLGEGFGAKRDTVSEIVFNTSMAGYQEILSDPSYTDQAIVMSYPLMGNYGIAEEDFESRIIAPDAFIVRDLNRDPSNFRSVQTLEELLEDAGVPGITGVDTRKLVRSIRDLGSRRCLLTDADTSLEVGLDIIRRTPVPHDSVRRRSCKKRWYSRTSNPRYNVTAIDCGMKGNIVRMLNEHKCNVTTLKVLRGEVPMFGICLGHQLLALSYGGETYKLKFGHRGGNHPVKDLTTGKIEITSQNHSYAVKEEALEGTGLAVTHVNVLDDTVEGMEHRDDLVFSVQYHPESCPGPQDSRYLFQRFTQNMDLGKGE